ncbi:hypothetical protein [Streptomyces tubercidicus]|uniref:Uncharacterized protein n=1 Tax=Streptomyces tubercidicus TaxID=47759 RepID=A0A640UXX3_9ACTN|nr:hypothetical protein [Streptomyces tubercidicus]WAU13261.1 hypothetical protein STRTU_003725 [Streptomyces tubercidicus]GFE38836.1 hypothetical protein Stube_35090 [Streptomyces tubercidicus]
MTSRTDTAPLAETSPEERLERLKGLLRGTRGTRAAQALRSSGAGNVLIGALLHAADRLRAGHQATDLEQKLLAVLRTKVPDAEIREWGRVYREAVNQLGENVAVVPRALSTRPMASGYSFADLRAGWGPVVAETMAKKNAMVVSREILAAGAPVEDAEFIAALLDNGGLGAVGFDRPRGTLNGASAAGEQMIGEAEGPAEETQGEGDGRAVYREFRAKLELENFYVHREVGDQGGGKDEIYWLASSGSDLINGPAYRSEEFGAVKRGETRSFSSNRVIFDGKMAKRLAMVLYCMEADQSTAAWYDDLMKALGDLAKALYALEFGNALLPGLPGADLVTLATELAKMGVILMEALRNYDDLSATRGIAFTAFDMALLYHRDGGNVAYHFNGDGHHELRMKYTGDPVPFPTGTLEYLVQDARGHWSVPISLGWESMSAPAVASYNGKLYAAFIRPSDQAVMWSVQEAGIWSEPQQVGGWRSYYPPALAAAHGKLYIMVSGLDAKLYWSTFTEATSWNAATQVSVVVNQERPSLTTTAKRSGSGETVWMTCTVKNGNPFTMYHDGTRWIPNLDPMPYSPLVRDVSMAPGTSVAYEPWRATRIGETVHVCKPVFTALGPVHWTEKVGPSWPSAHGPTLVTHGSAMHLLFCGTDGGLYTSVAGTQQRTRLTKAAPMDASAAVSHNHKLYVMYRR